jgi:hypothetical protein
MERSCLVKINLVSNAARNLTARVWAGSRIDFVSVAGSVWVPQNFISGKKVDDIDFGG